MPGLVERATTSQAAGPLLRLEQGSASAQCALAGLQHALSDSPVGRGATLASHILGRMAKIVPADWQPLYAQPIYWLETFVDTSRFAGTCYRAANWQEIGTTQGCGHRAPTLEPTRPVKKMLGLPLNAQFREILQR